MVRKKKARQQANIEANKMTDHIRRSVLPNGSPPVKVFKKV
jgi:hypothetical protein